MQLRLFFIVVFTLLVTFNTPAYAWNLQLGIHHLMPKLWTGHQSYESSSGEKLEFEPVIDETITGQTVSIGFFYQNFLFHFEQGKYSYDTQIPADNEAVTVDTDAEVEIMEQRLGINYHLERELAGIYVGAGITREQETVSTSRNEWQYEENVPFFKFGIDMILGAWRIRVEQIHYSLGEHAVKISSAGLLLYL